MRPCSSPPRKQGLRSAFSLHLHSLPTAFATSCPFAKIVYQILVCWSTVDEGWRFPNCTLGCRTFATLCAVLEKLRRLMFSLPLHGFALFNTSTDTCIAVVWCEAAKRECARDGHSRLSHRIKKIGSAREKLMENDFLVNCSTPFLVASRSDATPDAPYLHHPPHIPSMMRRGRRDGRRRDRR